MPYEGMRVAVRADASSKIGTGHIMRACAIFDELRVSGGDAIFICRKVEGHLADLLMSRGYKVYLIPDVDTQEADAKETLAVLSQNGDFDCIWVDHYGLDADWEQLMRGCVPFIAAMDDLANRPHDVDLLVDSSHLVEEAHLYDSLVEPNTHRLIGHHYIPLRREFFERKPRQPDSLRQPVKRLLITLGGNDPLNTTGLVLDALSDPMFDNLSIDVTTGTSNSNIEVIREQAAGMSNVSLYVQHPRPSDLMHNADLCIGAGGTTSWERCYMGLPTLGIILAANQIDIMEMLVTHGIVRPLGWGDKLDLATLRQSISDVIIDADWRVSSAQAGQALLDGQGALRIIEILKNNRIA